MNGEMEGFFQRERELKQGDPISPYLFLMVMEGFYAILPHKIDHSNFMYHTKSKVLNLNYLAFADDLFLLCGAIIHLLSLSSLL